MFCLVGFFFTYLITKMVNELKCLLQVTKHPLLAEQICTQELGTLHFEQPRCLHFLKMDPRWLCYVIVPGTTSPNTPNKLWSYTTSQRKMHRHDVQVWYPRQSLALDFELRLVSGWESRNNTPHYTCKVLSRSSTLFSFHGLLSPAR